MLSHPKSGVVTPLLCFKAAALLLNEHSLSLTTMDIYQIYQRLLQELTAHYSRHKQLPICCQYREKKEKVRTEAGNLIKKIYNTPYIRLKGKVEA
jgi:hypothetical protein